MSVVSGWFELSSPPASTLPALPSLTSNPTFFPATPSDPVRITTASTPYYPPPPSTSFRPPAGRQTLSPAGRREVSRHQDSDHPPKANGLSVSQSQASQAVTEWELAFERQEEEKWAEKVRNDLAGWRGGHGIVRSTYSRTAVPGLSYFGQAKTGIVGLHLPKEVVRVERDWSDGEVCQFETSFPMELDGRISPAKFQSLIESLNVHLTSAYSVSGAVIDNVIAIASWWTSLWWYTSCFERGLRQVEGEIKVANEEIFNPVGLNVLSPRDVALQYLEIE